MLCGTLTNRWRHWGGTTRLEVTACGSISPDQRRLSTCNCPAVLPLSFSTSALTGHRTSSIMWLLSSWTDMRSSWEIFKRVGFCVRLPHVSCHRRHISSLPFKASEGACCWGCLWGCPVPPGSRPLCCPPPRPSCGPKSDGLAAGPSSQSQSSTLWPSRRRRAQTARSCPPPAVNTRASPGVSDFTRVTGRAVSADRFAQECQKLHLTSWVLKNCDCSRTERISSSRCR